MTAQFESIFLGLSAVPGKLRIAASGLGWKSNDEKEPVTTVPAADIKWVQWIRVARNFQLRLGTTGANGKSRITFDGFLRDDFERLGNLCKQYYNTTIETKETSVRGWNWGAAEVQSQDIAFSTQGRTAFLLPLSQVHNTSITKSEVALELTSSLKPAPADEDAVAKKRRLRATPDEVSEVRFYIPGSATGAKRRSEKAKKEEEGGDLKPKKEESDAEEEEDDDDDMGGNSAAQMFHDTVKEKAEVGLVVGEILGTVPDVLCLTPRGRFDIDLHATFLRLRGKTYDYRIAYTQVQKLFLLPKPDDVHCQFVVNIDPPIRQGQTRYPYLVIQFVKDEMMELDLNLDGEILATPIEGLEKHYDDPAFEVVSKLFKALAGKKVTTPGNYQSHDGHAAVKCNVKAHEGQLYFLEKQLLFLSKQPTLVLHAQIHSVTFARVGGALPSARTFDLHVKLSSSAAGESIVFSSLNKEELESIEEFLRMKKVRVKNEMEEYNVVLGAVDEDMGGMSDSGIGGMVAGGPGDEEDEDSEVDEDFQASSESDSGGSGGDSGDEGGDKGNKMDEGSDEDAPEKKKARLD